MVSEWHKLDDNSKKYGNAKFRNKSGIHEKGKVGSTRIPLTQKHFDDFKSHLDSGDGIDLALMKIGIGRTVYTRWRKEYKDFSDLCEDHKNKHKKKR